MTRKHTYELPRSPQGCKDSVGRQLVNRKKPRKQGFRNDDNCDRNSGLTMDVLSMIYPLNKCVRKENEDDYLYLKLLLFKCIFKVDARYLWNKKGF